MDIKIPDCIYTEAGSALYEKCIKNIEILVNKHTQDNHLATMAEIQKLIGELCEEAYLIGYDEAY